MKKPNLSNSLPSPNSSVKDFMEELLEESRPLPSVDITTPSGKVLKFRQVLNSTDMKDLRDRMQGFLGVCKTAPPVEWKPYNELDPEILSQAFTIHYLSDTPKIPVLYALKIVHEAPYLAQQIMNELALNSSQGLKNYIEGVAREEGKQFLETYTDEISSTSAENTFQESTPQT